MFTFCVVDREQNGCLTAPPPLESLGSRNVKRFLPRGHVGRGQQRQHFGEDDA
jgi:hypothetical protein